MRAAWALIAALLLAGPAFAQEARGSSGERHFRAGSQAFRAGQYLAAARAFDDAYAADPRPAVTFSAAQAYRRQFFVDGDVAWLLRAKQLYQRYLQEQPAGGRREHAVTHLYGVELLLARRSTEAPLAARPLPTEVLVSCEAPGARISLDGGPSRPAPLVIEVAPGQHRVRATAPGYRTHTGRVLAVENRLSVTAIDLQALPGELLVVTAPGTEVWLDGVRVGVAPLPPTSASSGVRNVTLMRAGRRSVSRSVRVERGARTTLRVDLEPSGQRFAALWTLGGAGALALGSAVSGGLAVLAEQDAQGLRGQEAGSTLSASERDRYNAALERRNDYRAVSVGLLGAAVVTGGVGTLLYLLDPPAPPAPGRETSRSSRGGRARY